ncbi:uncharacterized protein [Periplaneta americana]
MAKPNPVMQLQKRVNTIEEQVVTLLPLVEEVHILKERLDKLISHSCVQGFRRCQTFLKEGHESLSKENQLQRDLEQRCAELETQLQQQQTRCTELEAQVQREQAHHTEAEVQVQQQQTRCAELEVQVQQEQTRCAELVMQVQQQQTRSAELEAQVQQQQTRCAEAEAKARELGAMAKPKPAMQLQERMETIEGQMVTLLPLVKEVRILKEFLSHLLSQSREQDCRKCESFLKEGNEALSREKQLKQDLEQRCAELEVQLQQQQTRCAELEAQVQQEQARRTEAESQVQQQETRGAKQIPEPSADVKQFLQSVRGTNNLKLIEAAKSGNTAAVQHLASAGVKVNICDESGFTPLHHAAEGGHTETVRVLLALRANVNARTSDKVTPLHRAALKGHEAVCDALLFAGADVNMCTARYESSPLHYAAESGALSVVQLLVCYGASCYSRNKYNHTSLEVAILRGKTAVAQYLQMVIKNF